MPARWRTRRPRHIFRGSKSSLLRATHRSLSRARPCPRCKGPLRCGLRNLIGDFEQFGFDLGQWHFAFGLADLFGELLLDANHLARMRMGELERLNELRLRHFVCGAFDHDHFIFSSDLDKIEIALLALAVGW